MNNHMRCRQLINDLLTSTNADGSLKYPDGLFVNEIKDELHASWNWGDIGGALNAPPLTPPTGEKPIVLMGTYAIQNNGYSAKRWSAVSLDNPYATRSLMENVRVAETMIKKAVNNRLRPALTAMFYAQGDADDLPTVNTMLDQALTNIKLARQAGDEKALRLKAEAEVKKLKAELAAAKAAVKAAAAATTAGP